MRLTLFWQICHAFLMLDTFRKISWVKATAKDFKGDCKTSEEDVEVIHGTGNVFRDLGEPDVDGNN